MKVALFRRSSAAAVRARRWLLGELNVEAFSECAGVLVQSREADIFGVVLYAGDCGFLGAESLCDRFLCDSSSFTRLAKHHAEFEGLIAGFKVFFKSRSRFLPLGNIAFYIAHDLCLTK